jgi:hypothetical protein
MCWECILLTPNPHNVVVRWGWSLEQGLADHLKHLKNGLNDGREVLQAILSERDQGHFEKGDPFAGRFNGAGIPEPGDK